MGTDPTVRFLHPPTDEERQECGQNADQKQPPPSVRILEREVAAGRQEKSGRPGGLQDAGRLGTLLFRPCFGDKGGAGRPFSADAERGEKAIDRKLPPLLSQSRGAGESSIDDDRRHEDLRAAEAVGRNAERDAADGPTDQKNRKDNAAVPSDAFRRRRTAGVL